MVYSYHASWGLFRFDRQKKTQKTAEKQNSGEAEKHKSKKAEKQKRKEQSKQNPRTKEKKWKNIALLCLMFIDTMFTSN